MCVAVSIAMAIDAIAQSTPEGLSKRISAGLGRSHEGLRGAEKHWSRHTRPCEAQCGTFWRLEARSEVWMGGESSYGTMS